MKVYGAHTKHLVVFDAADQGKLSEGVHRMVLYSDAQSLQAERDRLREALKWIANGKEHTGLWLSDIARRALEETKS